jgi:PAS domain S-box-containing protein
MTFVTSLLNNLFAPIWPASPQGWVGWLILLGLIGALNWYWRRYNARRDRRYWITFTILALLVPPTSLFLGIRLPSGAGLPLPGIPQEPHTPTLMLFSAVPWILAGGMLGPLAGAVLGALAGFFGFLWDMNSLFYPLELALLGTLFAIATRQRYRTLFFRLSRQPLITAFELAVAFLPIYLIDASLVSQGTLAVRLDYALTSTVPAFLAMAGELLIAGIFAQVLAFFFPEPWERTRPLEPSPAEKSLQTRFLLAAGSLILLLFLSLLAVNWLVAGRAARQMLRDRMHDSAIASADSVPFLLETGQNFAAQLASDPGLLNGTPDQLANLLAERILILPYFDQLILIDAQGQPIASYPAGGESGLSLTPEEIAGIALANNGVLSQSYTIQPNSPGTPARLSFMEALQTNGQTERILVGRTSLTTNPFAEPLISNLDSLSAMDGTGILLDENGRVVYSPDPIQILVEYPVGQPGSAAFYDNTAPDGTRELVYYQPVEARPWAVVLTVPAQAAQQLSITLAAPLSAMILFLAAAAMIALYLGLNAITVSLKNLTSEATRISQGDLNHSLDVEGVDEVGQLRRSFEQMRSSLKARLAELNSLLLVSQGVASSLDLKNAIQPVMNAIRDTGANSVRVVVTPADTHGDEQGIPTIFSAGLAREKFSHLDEKLLTLVQQQEILALSNVSRARSLGLDANLPQPASLLAVALRHENRFYGVIWGAYEQARSFTDADVRYFSTIAGNAALAAANARLFLTAEVGRQRLAAILASTPDPVLVTDSQNRLLFANPAARQALGSSIESGEGKAIGDVITEKALLDILQTSSPDRRSAEVGLPSGNIYLAMASPVLAEGHLVGRVCILQDVTHFKELDALKTDFVSSVSHDLRSPLTLVRGYATMLDMVGTLNEQQNAYVKKIISGVENMAQLISNLLDLGRIETGVGLRIEAVSIMEIINRVTSALQSAANEKEIKLVSELPAEDSPFIETDPTLLHQAIYNLVENAIKYTPARGKVVIRLKVRPEAMQLEVQDTGIGIPSADIPRLFEKFYRSAQREARLQKGSGLGLAIVHSIIERHGGKVWVGSQPGKGSTFFLLIPWKQKKDKPS